MKHLKLFENWTYNKLVSRYTDENDELKDIFKKYIIYKTNRNVISINRIYYDISQLWISYSLIDDYNRNTTTEFVLDNTEEFDEFAKNPDLFISQIKFNL